MYLSRSKTIQIQFRNLNEISLKSVSMCHTCACKWLGWADYTRKEKDHVFHRDQATLKYNNKNNNMSPLDYKTYHSSNLYHMPLVISANIYPLPVFLQQVFSDNKQYQLSSCIKEKDMNFEAQEYRFTYSFIL